MMFKDRPGKCLWNPLKLFLIVSNNGGGSSTLHMRASKKGRTLPTFTREKNISQKPLSQLLACQDVITGHPLIPWSWKSKYPTIPFRSLILSSNPVGLDLSHHQSCPPLSISTADNCWCLLGMCYVQSGIPCNSQLLIHGSLPTTLWRGLH